MDISLYYQILDIGISYEKGRKSGKVWKIGERKRLSEELLFWRKVLIYISEEEKGIACSEDLFESLQKICNKYKLPNYERVLEKKKELLNSRLLFERDKDEERKIRDFMEKLFIDMQKNLDVYKDKEMVYHILRVLHNLPKAMYGRNILNSNPNLISYEDAVNYTKNCMSEKMKNEYESFLCM